MEERNIIREFADNGGRRSGIERRRFSYSGHIPERRSRLDRRACPDRRNGGDRRTGEIRRSGEERRLARALRVLREMKTPLS